MFQHHRACATTAVLLAAITAPKTLRSTSGHERVWGGVQKARTGNHSKYGKKPESFTAGEDCLWEGSGVVQPAHLET